MKNKIIKSKRTDYGISELIENIDDFGKIINYTVVKAMHGKNIVVGVGKLEENNFLNKEEAINFFNNQK